MRRGACSRRAGIACRSALAGAVAVLTVATLGCGPLTRHSPGEPRSPGAVVRLYGSDGNMLSSFGDAFASTPGLLAGMQGTTALTPVSADFKRRLRGIDANLSSFNYAGETFDAVAIAALAAETAGSTEPAAFSKYVVAVTVAGPTGITCETVSSCLAAVRAGKDIAYRGISMKRSGLTEVGEPSTASYARLVFGQNNRIDDSKTEYVGAGDESTQATNAPTTGPPKSRPARRPPPLKVGTLLPRTGDLGFAGPPMFAAARLAVQEVNAAGGVLAQPVRYVDGDDGTDPQVAMATVNRLIAGGVQVIIGAGASGVTLAVLSAVIAAGRVMISPSATSDALSHADDRSLFFRTSPPDLLQAQAIVDIVMRDGNRRVAVVAREDSYGTGLQRNVQANLIAAGIKRDNVKLLRYPVRTGYTEAQFSPMAEDITGFRPDAVLVIGFAESANMIKALVTMGVRIHT